MSKLPLYGSEEWHQKNAAEVAGRPTARLERKPFTPEDFAPQKALSEEDESSLTQFFGPYAGLPIPAAAKLAKIILALSHRLAVLEDAQNPALAGVENRAHPRF